MDPVTIFGLGASVDQLCGAAKSIFSSLLSYYESVKGAPKRSRELRQELGAICELLDDLWEILPSKSQYTPSAILNESILEFQEMLNEMNERVAVCRRSQQRKTNDCFLV